MPIGATGRAIKSAGYVIPDSGVSRYGFEQDVTDTWGPNDGTDNTSAGYSTDSQQGDYAKDFDGVDDYVDLPFVVSALETFSIALWAKQRTFNSTERPFDETPGSEGAWMGTASGGVLRFGCYDGSGTQTVDRSIPEDEWFHAVLVVDNQNEVRGYVDGAGSSTSFGSINVSSQNGRLGAANDASEDHWNGLIDDVRIYDKPLSDTEVSNLYNTGSIEG